MHHPVTGAPGRGAGVLEEGDVAAGAAALVGVEQVVDGRIVLVDRLLHHPQAQQPRVEVDVRRCVAGDRGHVVDAFEAHRPSRQARVGLGQIAFVTLPLFRQRVQT